MPDRNPTANVSFCERTKFAVVTNMTTKTFGYLKAREIIYSFRNFYCLLLFISEGLDSNNILAPSPVLRNIAIASEHFEEAQESIYAETL
jgi:hypothetical protein